MHQEPARRTEISRHPLGWEIVRKIDQKDRKYIDKIIAPPEGLPPERKVFRSIREAVEKGGMPSVGPDSDWVDKGEETEAEAEDEAEDEAEGEEDEKADDGAGAEGKDGADAEAHEPGPARRKPKLQEVQEVLEEEEALPCWLVEGAAARAEHAGLSGWSGLGGGARISYNESDAQVALVHWTAVQLRKICS